MNIEIGTVFRWNNFPLPRHGDEEKARWFICVGFSGLFSQIASVYLCTTTTQIESFQSPGIRSTHSHFIFKTNRFPVFDQECAIDFDEPPYLIELTRLTSHQRDIEIKGNLDENTPRMIYKRLLSSKFTSPKILSDLHDSFNKVGITGLKKPRHPKR